MATLDDNKTTPLAGVTQTRCTRCQRFTKLAPGDTDCATCAGRLPLDLPTTEPAGGGQ